MKLYCITADYRPNNPNKPHYYVFGKNKKEAKDRFTDRISWLKIFDCEEIVDEYRKNYIVEHPYEFICF